MALTLSIPEKLLHASLADVYRWISQYRNIPVQLNAPPKLSPVEMVAALFPEVNSCDAESCRMEFLADYELSSALEEKMVRTRGRRIRWADWNEFLYMVVRFLKPEMVFETGVFDGQSSAIILRALQRNGGGRLLSIDLPAREAIAGSTDSMPSTTLPPGRQPGWLVPDGLRDKYDLVLGDSKRLLPRLLREYRSTDIFFHDSLHTFEHMYFEYTTAWPHVRQGGMLLSDDILWNPAFHRFCKEVGRPYCRLEGFGAVRK